MIRKRGFTLIELLVVIAIITLISGVVFAALSSARMKARDAQRLVNANQIAKALELNASGGTALVLSDAGISSSTNPGTGFVAKNSTDDATYLGKSIIASLKEKGVYASDKLIDPVYGKDNYYLASCPETGAYTVFLKMEQSEYQMSSTTLSMLCGGALATSLGLNSAVASLGGSGSGSGSGGGGAALLPDTVKSCDGCSTTNSWSTSASQLPANISHSQIQIIGSNIYLFGGFNGAAFLNVIYSAPVANPTAWVNTGAVLPATVGVSRSEIIGSYVYLFGGVVGGSHSNRILRAPLATPTVWADTGATLPGNLSFSASAIVGDSVYLFGGFNGATFTNVIYKAPLTNPTAWVNTGATLPAIVAHTQVVTIGDYLYMFGGDDGTTFSKKIYRAAVTSPTIWSDTGATLPAALSYSQALIIGDKVYLYGGHNGAIYTRVIYSAPVSSPTVWSNTGIQLPTAIASENAAIVGNMAYIFGSDIGGGTSNRAIYYAPITRP